MNRRAGIHRAGLAAYAVAVVAATLVHDPAVLAAAGVAAALLAGRGAGRALAWAVRSVVVFNAVVSASYLALAGWRGESPWHTLALINARVVLIAVLTRVATRRIDMFAALSFSRSLVYLLTVATSQAMTFRRMVTDYRLAFTSRSAGPVRLSDRYRRAAATASLALRRAMHEAGEIAMAMSARGFFDD